MQIMFLCLIIIAAFFVLVVLPLERVLLVLPPVPPFTSKVRVSVPCMQLLMLLEKAWDGESLPARVTRPGLLARVSSFVDV